MRQNNSWLGIKNPERHVYQQGKRNKKRAREGLQKYSDAETLSTTKIATQVGNTIKRKEKKHLQKDYEELQVAHIISQEKITAELQADREKNKLL